MAEASVQSGGMSRREFLYYIWIASIAVFTAEFAGLFIWFAIPRFRAGEFGGLFEVALTEVPELNAPPSNRADGRFWIVNIDNDQAVENDRMYPAPNEKQIKGVAAIYKVCTHLGCIYDWNAANNRFECPCHGSKYRLDGRRVESPAPRTLDRFKLIALDAEGTELASSPLVDGFYEAFELPANTDRLQVDTGDRVDGPTDPLLCDVVFGTC